MFIKTLLWKLIENKLEDVAADLFREKFPQKKEEEPPKEVHPIVKIAEEAVKESKLVTKSGLMDVSTQRFIKLGPDTYFCRGIKATTFCNKEDFKGESAEWYQLGTYSVLGKVHRDKMKGLRGISLPYKISNALECTIIHPKTGKMVTTIQVDVGPGWTDDPFWRNGSDPKNEKGLDYLGNRSVLAGIDFFPQIWEDLGIMSFEEAYEGSPSGYFDLIIRDPKVGVLNHVPTKDSRAWFSQLPPTGSPHFTWKELLRDWKSNSRPSDEQIKNLQHLVQALLHPAREALGKIRCTSGLRDKATNSSVGGRSGSLHLEGRAADLVPVECSLKELWDWFTKNTKSAIRENVYEYPGKPNTHVHIAGPIRPGENQNIRIKE